MEFVVFKEWEPSNCFFSWLHHAK